MMRRLRKQRGFTLVELMIVVAIIGILAALAVYGVKRYLTSAKTGEAKENLGRMGKDATAAYQRENMNGSVITDDTGEGSAGNTHRLCITAGNKVPQGGVPSNAKIQPASTDWTGNSRTGWKCLRFAVNDPIYYQYDYTSDAAEDTAGTTFTGTATGDLDGVTDTTSVWSIEGAVVGGEARLAPTIKEPDDYTL